MTYARARLWLGISGVGTLVSLAAAALLFDLPGRLPEPAAGVALLAIYLLVHLPFDYLGGNYLPARHGRGPRRFWPPYLRGLLIQSALLALCFVTLLWAGRWGGLGAVLLWQLLLLSAMVAWQPEIARLVGGLRGERFPAGVAMAGEDPGFTGGIAGWPGRERFVLPAGALPAEVARVVLVRWRAAIQSGSRSRGLLVAIVWNLGGFALSTLWPGAGVDSAVALCRTALGFTLWSFLGLLVLPTVSRWGVFEVDQYARRLGVRPGEFAGTVRLLDQRQDDEPRRAPGIEAIFHPIPNVESRVARYEGGPVVPGAWNAARSALYLSWPCLGLLNRAVHCNAGRPELWVFLPVD